MLLIFLTGYDVHLLKMHSAPPKKNEMKTLQEWKKNVPHYWLSSTIQVYTVIGGHKQYLQDLEEKTLLDDDDDDENEYKTGHQQPK